MNLPIVKMASPVSVSTKQLQIVSYNLHGLNQGCSLLTELCSSRVPDIIFIQEHWQTPANIDKLLCFSDNYVGFGISAMDRAVSQSILQGRPYGGVAILANKNLISSVKIEMIHAAERVVIISIGNTILINVYFPPASATTASIIGNILDEVSGLLHDFQNCSLIFGGDLNTNLHENTAASVSIKSFMQRHYLKTADNCLDISNCVTYCHNSLLAKSYIDFLTVSRDLISDIDNYYILDHALNHSDHCPIVLSLHDTWFKKNISIGPDMDGFVKVNIGNNRRLLNLRWDHANLSTYYDHTFIQLMPLLDRINNMYSILINGCSLHSVYDSRCASCIVKKEQFIVIIEKWYQELVFKLASTAEKCIPVLQVNALKFWWSQEASDLKDHSISAHHAWVLANKPQQGFLYDEYKSSKYRYKLFLKKEKKKYNDKINDSLLNDLSHKDHKRFWKTWKSKFGKNKNVSKIIDGSHNEQTIANTFASYFTESCMPNSRERYNSSEVEYRELLKSYSCNVHSLSDYLLSVNLVDNIIQKLKLGKAAGLDKLSAEHIKYGHPCIQLIITKYLIYC